jgi:hypothetical protein
MAAVLLVLAALVLLAAAVADGQDVMKTYPAKTSADGRLLAFEVENAYIGPAVIARLLEQVADVSDVKRRRMFSGDGDVHVRFKHYGQPCIVWEPYGDNSRFWIGPENVEAFTENLRAVEQAFESYNPPTHRAVIGNLLTLRFLK